MKQPIYIFAAMVATGCGLNVNEPKDPALYESFCTKQLRAADLKGTISKVHYVNLDFNACIIEGTIDTYKLSATGDVVPFRRWVSTTSKNGTFGRRYVVVLQAESRSPLFAFMASTTQGEAQQGDAILKERLRAIWQSRVKR